MSLHQKKQKKVEVAVRLRPLIYEYEDVEAWSVNSEWKRITSLSKLGMKSNINLMNQWQEESVGKRKSKVQQSNLYEFTCDHVFKDDQSNWEVYSECCERVVEEFMQGQNGTIFMYGQTTSGKTYTMLGDQQNQGLIRYSLKDIFRRHQTNNHNQFNIQISYLEIYNQQIHDLLNQGSNNLKIVDHTVQGLLQCKVTSIEESLQLLSEGQLQRSYSQKKHHDHSSRSHTIFQMVMKQKIVDSSQKVKCQLNLVDLSGSQRYNEDQTNQETSYINKSLFVLSNVIHKLANPKKNHHIPFRDSKLTRLLAPSLTTSYNTVIICTISPAEINFSQTLSTLRFATQSRKIQLKSLDQSLQQNNQSINSNGNGKMINFNQKKISELLEENSILKKNLSFAQEKQEDKFIENKVKIIQKIIQENVLKVKNKSLNKQQWKNKAMTLSNEYEKNIEILKKQYLKAVINLSATEFDVNKSIIQSYFDRDSKETQNSLLN